MPFNKINNYIVNDKQEPITLLGNKKSIKNVINLDEFGNGRDNDEAGVKVSKKCFHYDYIIGKGGFGKVWKIEHTKNRNQYAMKEMLKSL